MLESRQGTRRFLPSTRGGLLWRGLLASILVIAFAAGATATAGLLQVSNLAAELSLHSQNVKGLTLPAPGKPETLLLIGSDHRAGSTSYVGSNTDTMLLVRLDDASQTVNIMSVPRDLEIMSPAGYPAKLNSIYSSDGGPAGLISVMRHQVFPHLEINHVIDTNFTGFSNLIDAIGCVYSQVDHRYYNLTQPAPSADNYSSIDIQPGYQRLCGGVYSNTGTNSALAFVRFRHTDSDVVRNARQQDFIRWAKENYSTTELFNNRDRLIRIFAKYTQPDKSLGTTASLLDLFDLVLGANKLTLKTIPFPEYFGACGNGTQTPCYVYPCPQLSSCTGYGGPNPPIGQPTQATEATWRRFITPTLAPVHHAAAPSGARPLSHRAHRGSSAPNLAGLTPDPGDGTSQAGQLGNAGLPVYYPRAIVGGVGAGYCFSLTANCDNPAEPASAYLHSYPRRYLITGPGNHHYRSYVMTLVINGALGEYYTVQGTTWQNPPILHHPSSVVNAGGHQLLVYDDGSKIALVAFHTPRGAYWVANSLANVIPNNQMIALAAGMIRYVPKG